MSERTFHQISQQYEAGHETPTVLIRRSSGEIQTAHLTGMQDRQGRRYVEFLDAASGETSYKPIAAEGLADETQARFAQELTESADRTPEELERINKAEKDLGSAAVEQVVQAPQSLLDQETVADKKIEVKLKAENIERAAAELERVFGGELARVLEDVADDGAGRREAIDPNTGSTETRDRVEAVIRAMLDELGEKQLLPERVQDNSPGNLKNISSSRFGYEKEKYRSRDYAAKLALAMLDGSFDGDPKKRDYDDLSADDPRNGQHRQAARMALDEFAKQKAERRDEEHIEDGDESFGDIKRVLRQLGEDDTFQRAKFSVHELRDRYYQGLPQLFDPHEVVSQFHDHVQHLRIVSDDIETALRRIYTVSDDIAPQHRAELEHLQMEMVNSHAQLENTIAIEIMLMDKLDELNYDQNALLEVRTIFAQQFPLALSSLSQAAARIDGLASSR